MILRRKKRIQSTIFAKMGTSNAKKYWLIALLLAPKSVNRSLRIKGHLVSNFAKINVWLVRGS